MLASLQTISCLHRADATSSFLKDAQVFHYEEGPEVPMKAAGNRKGATQARLPTIMMETAVCACTCIACQTRKGCNRIKNNQGY